MVLPCLKAIHNRCLAVQCVCCSLFIASQFVRVLTRLAGTLERAADKHELHPSGIAAVRFVLWATFFAVAGPVHGIGEVAGTSGHVCNGFAAPIPIRRLCA